MSPLLERTTIAKELSDLCKARGVTLAAVCKARGLKYSTLHAQIHNHRPIPFETIVEIARFFDVPLERFSSYRPDVEISSPEGQKILHEKALAVYEAALRDQQLAMMRAGYGVGTDDVLDWLRSQNGQLTNFDALQEHVDLFHPIQSGDTIFRPVRVGRLSLATRAFRAEDEAHFMRIVSGFDQRFLQRVVKAHVDASIVPYRVSDEKIDVTIDGVKISGSYRRIIAPVTDLQGNRLTLVHSKRI
ncbi:MAG: helix-turn-helix transcriptional regulator [Pseudomonadota bacterium]